MKWAKTENTLLYNQEISETGEQMLGKAAAPAFEPLALASGKNYDDFIWSPDSRYILYSSYGSVESSIKQIYIMDADGNNARVLNQDASSIHYIWLEEWLDQENVIFTDYTGGGHGNIRVLNSETGELASWGATIHGQVYSPNNSYVPATSNDITGDQVLMVIAKKFSLNSFTDQFVSGNFSLLPEYKSVPRKQTYSIFEEWLPNSNQILLFWGYFDPVSWEKIGHDLLIWDIETNSVDLIAPNGKGGQFSPDGKVLAYLTSGPALIDQNQKPVEEEPEGLEPPVDFMQLLDMNTGKVLISLPVFSRPDYDDLTLQSHGYLTAQFSPNSRFLAFLSPGKVQTDTNGWPAKIDPADTSLTTMNVLDLQEKTLVWSTTSNNEADFSWSPAGNLLAFQDESQNWQLLNIEDMQITPITQTSGEHVDEPEWSYDGRYLSLVSCLPSSEYTCHSRSIHIFDVTLTE